MKSLAFLIIIAWLSSCNSGQLNGNNLLHSDVMKSMTELATIGQFEKMEYKFVEAEKNLGSSIQLTLYNSHLATDSTDEKEIALETAKEFLHKFKNSKKYDSVLVTILVTEKGKLETIRSKNEYRFATSGL